MRSIYLDNSATTKVYPEVAEEMCKTMMADYGNPSAKHLMGVEAEGEGDPFYFGRYGVRQYGANRRILC